MMIVECKQDEKKLFYIAQLVVGFALYGFHIHKKNKSENEIKT
jgi:hypothetical protein